MPAGVASTHRVPGEIKRREVELDPQVSPEEIMSREVELGRESWTSFASGRSSTAVQRTLSLWLRPNTAVETAVAQRASRWAMARGHDTALTLPLFWRRSVHGLSGLFRAVSAVEPSLSRPLPPPPPPYPRPPPPPQSPPLIVYERKAIWSRSGCSTISLASEDIKQKRQNRIA